MGLINKLVALISKMTWHRNGNKPVSESVIDYCTDAYIYVIRHRWVNHTIYNIEVLHIKVQVLQLIAPWGVWL